MKLRAGKSVDVEALQALQLRAGALFRDVDMHAVADSLVARQAIGSELLRHLIDLARARGYHRVALSTFNHLAWNGPFYERFGFSYLGAADLTPALVEVRNKEAAAGLDMRRRAIETARCAALTPS